LQVIYRSTRRTNFNLYPRLGDRPWNNPGPRRGVQEEDRTHLPLLRAVILDFSSVNNVDVTSVQNLIDVRNQLDLYASPEPVQWHFAHINNRWTKRALASAGFGYPTPTAETGFRRWKPIFSVAEIGGSTSAAAAAEREARQTAILKANDVEVGQASKVIEHAIEQASESGSSRNGVEAITNQLHGSQAYQEGRKIALVHGINRPLFHMDLTSAVQSAVSNAQEMDRHFQKTAAET